MKRHRIVFQSAVSCAGCVFTYIVAYYLMVGKVVVNQAASPAYFLFGDTVAAFFRPMYVIDARLRRSYWGTQEPVRTSGKGSHLLVLVRGDARALSREEIERCGAEVAMGGDVLVVECEERPYVYLTDSAKSTMDFSQRRAIRDRLQAKGYVETENPRVSAPDHATTTGRRGR